MKSDLPEGGALIFVADFLTIKSIMVVTFAEDTAILVYHFNPILAFKS